jgi:hypothetical protein
MGIVSDRLQEDDAIRRIKDGLNRRSLGKGRDNQLYLN